MCSPVVEPGAGSSADFVEDVDDVDDVVELAGSFGSGSSADVGSDASSAAPHATAARRRMGANVRRNVIFSFFVFFAAEVLQALSLTFRS